MKSITEKQKNQQNQKVYSLKKKMKLTFRQTD